MAGLSLDLLAAQAERGRLGELLGTVPFVGERGVAVAEPVGTGHQARLALDLSTLTPARLVTATDDFFVRTGYPDLLNPGDADRWTIDVDGLVREPAARRLRDFTHLVSAQGVHQLECSGNGARRGFGLLSATRWDGIPLAQLFEDAANRAHGHAGWSSAASTTDRRDSCRRRSVPAGSSRSTSSPTLAHFSLHG